ncbi:universal stress protein [Cellulophaga sp. E16_2]|uniref:UspA domain-containing protein n=1 Tax=Cellulophaga algicola (strain DSM 14237 / IC166 / ACAM 630) TaxID=688270 RepID=E6XF69_CELAD|nr:MULTISPECIES: universal stress protein [Cellulophaga]ADV50305.1 UspA domain-containing protein [Cellulophaga algicola DSM 14237]MBO0592707.1 universal stress protein [Cellulophaga sp. E16_2]
MTTVLIPTDFSTNAMHAISYALDLYKCEQTIFYFIHAYADEVYGTLKNNTDLSISEYRTSIEKQAKKQLSNLITDKQEKNHNPKHEYKGLAIFESLVDAVNDTVNEINIDVIIMGTKGQTADKKITFGSQTVQVFKYVKCPVLAIPETYSYQQPKNILFPTDYNLPYKRRELKLLNALAHEFKSTVYCLHISDFETLSLRQLDNKQFLEESLPNTFLSFEQTPVKNRLNAIMISIEEKDIDLLVMVNSRHSFLEDMLFRSTVDKIGLKIHVPFLVLQNLSR